MKSYRELCEPSKSAIISNIQHFSLHDGPGVRTTVFFKGCNLHCAWCHNPETISPNIQIAYNKKRCILCRSCVDVCVQQARRFQEGEIFLDADKCITCGACADACPTNALELYGTVMPLKDILSECLRDKHVFPDFGGVTFSGGECLLQIEQLLFLASELRKKGVHVCVDTALNTSWSVLERLIPVTDLFLVDLKAGTEMTHKKYTGASQRAIIQNLKRLTERTACWIRIPIIRNVNDMDSEIDAMIGHLHSAGPYLQKIQLLQYHSLGEAKYIWLSQTQPEFQAPTEKRQNEILNRFREEGFCAEWN